MKRVKFDKTKEFVIYKVDTYSKGARQYPDGSFFEHRASYLYYFETEKKRLWAQERWEFKNKTLYYVTRTPHKSIAAMEKKFHNDFERFKNIFSEFKITVTEMAII